MPFAASHLHSALGSLRFWPTALSLVPSTSACELALWSRRVPFFHFSYEPSVCGPTVGTMTPFDIMWSFSHRSAADFGANGQLEYCLAAHKAQRLSWGFSFLCNHVRLLSDRRGLVAVLQTEVPNQAVWPSKSPVL